MRERAPQEYNVFSGLKTKKNTCIIYMRERAPQEYNVFSSLKILYTSAYIQSTQWYSTMNDNMTDKHYTIEKNL